MALNPTCEDYPGSVHHSCEKPRYLSHHDTVVMGLLQPGFVSAAIGQLCVLVRGS